jgi:hypothetical protein
MAEFNPKIGTTKPVDVFNKPLKADFKELFKALSKGVGHAAHRKMGGTR